MTDVTTRQRVARLRQSRRERGETETNVWLPKEIRAAIDAAVDSGLYPSRRLAIADALKRVFIETGAMTTT